MKIFKWSWKGNSFIIACNDENEVKELVKKELLEDWDYHFSKVDTLDYQLEHGGINEIEFKKGILDVSLYFF
jgi:hypothetical protein